MRIIFCLLLFISPIVFNSCTKKDIQIVSPGRYSPPPPHNNGYPIANAGSDMVISLPQSQFLLNGVGSYDPNGRITTYLWEQVSGPSFYQYSIHAKNAASTTAAVHVAGTYQFQLTVVDNSGLSAKDTVQIVVEDFITPPQIRGQEVTFNNLEWQEQQDDYDPNIFYVWISTFARPDLFLNTYMKVEVWLQSSPTASWIKLKPWFENNSHDEFTYSMHGYLHVDMWPPDRRLVGQKASIRVKFL